ncbi:MAG: peptide ABC transporter substrate-binding protein [Verrucomicrobiota bacterium]
MKFLLPCPHIYDMFPAEMLRQLTFSALCLCLVSCEKESQIDQANREGILILGNANDPKSLDPQVVTGVLDSNVMRALFEGLIQFHPSEDLATPLGSALEVTPDETATIWTVKLRPDAKWSDGREVTSEDYAFAYQRILTPDLAAKYAEMLYFVDGAEAFNKGETKDFSTVGIEIIDSHNFKIKLRGPTPYFREVLKHYTWGPVPKHAVTKHGEIGTIGNPWSKVKNHVSNGPFRLKSYRRNHHIEVEQNPYYWNAKNVSLKGIRFLPISNSFTEARMFRDGQLHVTYSAPKEVVDLMKKTDPSVLRQEPYFGTDILRFNTTRKPMDDVRVRRALSMTLDRDALCKNVYSGYNPTFGLTPPTDGYQPPRGVKFDPTEAKKLFAEAGFPDGKGFPTLKLLVSSREAAATIGAATQAMWREHLGVEIEIENKEWTAYLVAMQSLDFDMVSGGWIGDYIDPLTFLEMWTPGNGNNNTGWVSQPYLDKLNESLKVTDPTERYIFLKQAEEILLADAPMAPVAWRSKNYLIHPSVKGWDPVLLDCHPYTNVRLVPQKD